MFKHKFIAVMCTFGLLAVASVSTSTAAHADAPDPTVLWNVYTNKCADLPGYGTPVSGNLVTQYTCNNTTADNQQWYVQPVDYDISLQKELYEIVNVKSGLCLDPPNYGADGAGTYLHIYQCNAVPANDNQEWYTINTYDGSGNLLGPTWVNYKSGLCLDVAGWASNGSDASNDLPLTLYYCYGSSWANSGWDDHGWGWAW